MTLQVELAVPEGELWAGPAALVIAKTLDGDIGVLTGHSPVLGILAEGSMVRIRTEGGTDGVAGGDEVVAAVSGGFFSVADDRVSILARQAQLGAEVDTSAARAALDESLQQAEGAASGSEEPADVRYYRALLRAAGEPADGALPEPARRGPGLAGGRLALDAGWLLVVVLVVAIACAVGIAVRRNLIERGGGSIECGLRRVPGRRWRLGLAAYQPDELRWYPVFGLWLRPAEVFARHALSVVSRRPADPVEMTSVGSGAVVVECDTGQGPGSRIELALSEDALTGFLAWLEAAPPGPVSEFR